LLDRLVRGRAWIPVLGVMLAGIVAMQVEVLKLGTSVGRWMQRASTLQTKNEALQASVASLADEQRIERLAAGAGMLIPAPTAVSFLHAQKGGVISRALSNIHAPDPSGFLANLPATTMTQSTPTASIAPSTGGNSSTTSATAPPATGAATTTGAPTISGAATTTATTQPAAPAAASGAPAPNTGATSSSSATQTPATGAAAIGPSGTGTTATPSGG
jgi:cell division protein FtsL